MAKLMSEGEFATIGEKEAAALLKQLPDGWLVVANKTIVAGNGRDYEVDFVVVGRNTIFIIDEKSWWGRITGNKEEWRLSGGETRRSPLSQAGYVCKILAGELKNAIPELRAAAYFCKPGVLLSLQEEMPDISDNRLDEAVFLRGDILARLPQVDSQGGDPLIGAHRDRIEATLTGLGDRTAIPSRIEPYEVVERLGTRPGCSMLRAQLADEKYTLMLYDLGLDPLEVNQTRDFYMQELRALQRLSGKGVAPECSLPFPWSTNFVVLPIRLPAAPTLRSLKSGSSQDGFLHEITLAKAAYEALRTVHAQGIVHRALSPDTILVVEEAPSPRVLLTDFYAARVGAQSIAPRLDALDIDDSYLAPALHSSYANASAKTDVFSLALVFLERLSGKPVEEIYGADGRITVPDLVKNWPTVSEQDLVDVKRALDFGISERSDATSIAAWLGRVVDRLSEPGKVIEGRLLDGRYRVIRLLGEGAHARTFHVEDMTYQGNEFAVKQYRYPSAVLPQAGPEFALAMNVFCRNVVRVHHNNGPESEAHVVMQYVRGPTLADMQGTFPFSLEKWSVLKDGLLRAVGELEQHSLLHRDIKPSNVIMHEDTGEPVLIDFGFAVRAGIDSEIAGTPLYLPPEASESSSPPPTMDRYAVALVLLQAITGKSATDLIQAARLQSPITIGQDDARVRRLQGVLLLALHPNQKYRPKSVLDLRRLIENALTGPDEEEGEELKNEWVSLLRTLYRFSDVGNANNRGLDTDFVKQTYVDTALDTQFFPRIVDKWPLAVFLSGNPGDGKTAFLETVRDKFEAQGGLVQVNNPSGWEMALGSRTIRACYDASESYGSLSSDEQLTLWLSGLEGSGEPVFDGTVLIAINDGRLVDYFDRHSDQFEWLGQEVEDARTFEYGEPSRVWVVDLKQRTLVAKSPGENMSLFRRVLARLLPAGEWSICHGCAASKVCPLYSNSRALQNETIIDRLEWLLLLNHLRHQRHMTMRDLRSVLSYMIVGDVDCEKVHAARAGKDPTVRLADKHYWHTVFTTRREGDDVYADLATLDPGVGAQPVLERVLYRMRHAGGEAVRERFFMLGAGISPLSYSETREWMASMKRRAYFEAEDEALRWEDQEESLARDWRQRLLPYRHAEDFVAALQYPRTDQTRRLEMISEAMLRSSHIYGTDAPDAMTVVAAASEEQRLAVLKEYPLERFKLEPRPVPNRWKLEMDRDTLVLSDKNGRSRLLIGIDLYEFLAKLANGSVAWAPEYVPFLEDLAPFLNTLLLEESNDLVLLENRRRRFVITQREGKIVRLTGGERNSR